MGLVNATIAGRQFRLACEDGQEEHLQVLAKNIDERIGELRQKFGEIGDTRLTVMAALTVADELCIVRSMYTFNPTHTPARNLIHSGSIAATRPTLGAWISYGLGTENQNLPGFVALSPSSREGLWRAGFLPSEHQGTHFNQSEVDPEKMIRYLRNKQLDAKGHRSLVIFPKPPARPPGAPPPVTE